MIKTLIRIVSNIRPLADLINNGPLAEYDWFRTWHSQESIDGHGRPIPWITYPALEFLTRYLPRDIRVFEYGCGNSTLWWSERASAVVSVEHDADWYAKIAPKLPPHCTIHHVALEPDGQYAKKILADRDEFDVVLIDGRDRVNCLEYSLQALAADGIIVFDNSDRDRYQSGIKKLLSNGWRRVAFVGYSPVTSAKNETSIFYRTGNLLGL